uniref:Dickkopf N-terminal cysteine-rich domain-containing protein n=1 Tax=Electrophorus electricus TaxID=8005 RepID=A0AAY5EAU3_ELEEL
MARGLKMSTAPRLLCVLCVYVCVLAAPAMGGSDSSCDTEVPPSMRVLGSRACRPASVINMRTFQVACNQDRACGKGFSCDRHFGLCVPLRQEGGYCRRDAQCVRGLGCMFGRCIRRIPEGQEGKGNALVREDNQISEAVTPALCFPLFLGARCKVDKDCEASMCCARHHGERVCKQRLALGESCFVPDGGLAFSINQICPCQEGLLCPGYTAILIYVIRMPTVCCYGVDFYFEMCE